MEKRSDSAGAGGSLPLSSLRLMASPLQLTYSYIWQVIRHRNVKQYGKVEEFVTMVTQTVPELISFKQTAQLVLGLRARVRLLCVCASNCRLSFVFTADMPHTSITLSLGGSVLSRPLKGRSPLKATEQQRGCSHCTMLMSSIQFSL
ncbi:hypothetical protein EYF80_014284 [Liparis tanakae]|uniref:TERF1-interacting nuclear factor 2 N-terminal domain-containing protein n=1 Tax=Liparis tanakae TaxID=230148 RepID=A0A4Z2IDT4_9TELE|nr:hypothetical protein EYF80_014284 [Liparis tanakae]